MVIYAMVIIEFLKGYSQSIIAACALIVSIYVVFQQNQFNRDSVLPYCNVINDCISGHFVIKVQNVGQGPMIIDKIKYMSAGGDEYIKLSENMHIHRLLESIKKSENRIDGKGISPGNEMFIFEAYFVSEEVLMEFWKLVSEITVQVRYKDIYGTNYDRDLDLYKEYDEYMKVRGSGQKII